MLQAIAAPIFIRSGSALHTACLEHIRSAYLKGGPTEQTPGVVHRRRSEHRQPLPVESARSCGPSLLTAGTAMSLARSDALREQADELRSEPVLEARHQCGLTPRSRRGPTARQPARFQVVRIILPAGGLPRRRPRLTSNVRFRRAQNPRDRHLADLLRITAHESSTLGTESDATRSSDST